jgi:hypothetical protein
MATKALATAPSRSQHVLPEWERRPYDKTTRRDHIAALDNVVRKRAKILPIGSKVRDLVFLIGQLSKTAYQLQPRKKQISTRTHAEELRAANSQGSYSSWLKPMPCTWLRGPGVWNSATSATRKINRRDKFQLPGLIGDAHRRHSRQRFIARQSSTLCLAASDRITQPGRIVGGVHFA